MLFNYKLMKAADTNQNYRTRDRRLREADFKCGLLLSIKIEQDIKSLKIKLKQNLILKYI